MHSEINFTLFVFNCSRAHKKVMFNRDDDEMKAA